MRVSMEHRGRSRAPLVGAALLALSVASVSACAQRTDTGVVKSREHALRVVKVVEGLEHPWALAFLPDGRMLVTERPGRLRVVQDGKLLPQPVAGLPPIAEHGQGGLLDVALHPKFAENRWIYLSYAGRGDGGIGTEVLRARLAGDRLEEVRVIFRQAPKLGGGRHF